MKWNIVPLETRMVQEFSERFKLDVLASQLFLRRGIDKPEEMQFFLEDDIRYSHSAFLFTDMEDVVERIHQAIDEKEKIMVFGDRDVDGMTSLALMAGYLRECGADVQWQLPMEDAPYGLSMEVVQAFAANEGTLIITVDCGITNIAEIAAAADGGIDTIVIDHHNTMDVLPDAVGIINPKVPGEAYPFDGISAAALCAKVVWALRFSGTSMYNQEFCLVHVKPGNQSIFFEAVVMKNFVSQRRLAETVSPETASAIEQRIVPFIQGLPLFVFDWNTQKALFSSLFGSADVLVHDLSTELYKRYPVFDGKSLIRIMAKSKSARYSTSNLEEMDGLIQVFKLIYGTALEAIEKPFKASLSLVALSLVADMMPMIDENRILMREGLRSLSDVHEFSPGLHSLLVELELARKPIKARDIGWKISPVLNSAGRMGKPDVALRLLLSRDPSESNALVKELVEMNSERKRLGEAAWKRMYPGLRDNMASHSGRFICVCDETIPRGITGILAGRLSREFNVPAAVMAKVGAVFVGSIRTVRGMKATVFLSNYADLLEDFGGHDAAGGFYVASENVQAFIKRLSESSSNIELSDIEESALHVDIELPAAQLAEDVWKMSDLFLPSGQKFGPAVFCIRGLKVRSANLIGKEGKHLSLECEGGGKVWPAVFWDGAIAFTAAFQAGDVVDVVCELEMNQFRNDIRPQIVVKDLRKSL